MNSKEIWLETFLCIDKNIERKTNEKEKQKERHIEKNQYNYASFSKHEIFLKIWLRVIIYLL